VDGAATRILAFTMVLVHWNILDHALIVPQLVPLITELVLAAVANVLQDVLERAAKFY
jgi:hypothetical protein